MNPEIFIELSKLLAITLVFSALARFLKQPALIGYIVSGVVAGPVVLNVINSTDTLAAFSQIGVVLLLFLVGLNLNPKVIKDVGAISLVTGIGQVLFTTIVGFFIARLLGFSLTVSLYVAVALAFSSTIVIMKLLSDKRELESLYGRISVGFLIVQDLIVILILLFVSSLSHGADLASLALETLLKGLGGIAVLLLLTIYVLPKLTKLIARSQEFLLLFSITWCFTVASLFHYLNFSIEAGALLAGITLSMSPYHIEIGSKMRPLRDFFLILFFIMLGSQMVFDNVFVYIIPIIIFSLFVLIGNPLIVMALMGFLGYTKRNSFLSGLTVAQISEFSLIFVALGVSVGHVNNEILSLVTAVGLITFAGSTYAILYSTQLYDFLAKYLSIFERKGHKKDEQKIHFEDSHDIILFGYNRIGFDILEAMKKIQSKFLIIDYDPEVVAQTAKQGHDCRFGDANNAEFLSEINFAKARMIISTIPILETNLLLIKTAREVNAKLIIAVVSHKIDDAVALYAAGATYVLMPHFLGSKHFSTMLEKNGLSLDKFLEEKIAHIEHLRQRRKIGQDHPRHEWH